MAVSADALKGRSRRVRKNLRKGFSLAWAASPSALVRFSVLGMVSATMTPVAVYLGAVLVNRIAEARAQSLLVQPMNTKEIRAYVLADYLLERHRERSEELYRLREQMYRSGTRVSMWTGLVTGTALALAYLFVARQGHTTFLEDYFSSCRSIRWSRCRRRHGRCRPRSRPASSSTG